ncbi:LPS export ABC transporter periplasmic protein LptC [Aetokthonos hydrillicola Thurmond2011]|jgi:LPS export ABC transporter protein LptC|uniref:LPS export ABC transporter periplasmic protein LptC n=1 Tax=Aetokthonos hydrillicola Thurmond2011 TaxID=2712845 RepID=A0AAP5MBV6_9CYAN|nr:LPS export ABC transporter periplasmic protein LptC [Aetokthonos hydrillicola]MBO3458074.1 LPS export ABC transporter periplasmic protein LptC [Aetokthonos hydrillicola CCALA 1050]MBW4587090.1 LPS export ABC transporter periplasmic protein LptC [Aetokthonos hydrillicola CCALA 1050]MDR9899660.1 LPS export ABC transporter periplasmic protein LptC [Aetokthonos hydrillicola Thurmond2011]
MKQQGKKKGRGEKREKHFSPFPLIILPVTFCTLIALSACGNQSHKVTTSPTQSPARRETDSNLNFFDVIFEQADEVGRPIWKVKAKRAKYIKEKQIGQAENPYGELYQDGKVAYQVQGQQADIKQDGKQLFLQGKIVATNPHNGVVLRGNELEWRPKEDLLIVRNQLNVTHKQLKAVAQEARVKTREEHMEFLGGVVATSTEPALKMQTDHLFWQIKEEKLIGDRPVKIDHYQNNQITDRGRGDTAEVNLKTKIATVTKNAQVELLDPPMQIASNSMTWDLNAQNVSTNQPVRVFHRAENIRITANQGQMNIPQRIVYLTGNVNSIGKRGQVLKSKTLTWYLNNHLVNAAGDVFYRQIDPPLSFTGQTASGNLEAESITVHGGDSGGRVLTEIIPQK